MTTLTNRLCVDIEDMIFQYLDFETLEKTRHLQSDYVKMVTQYGHINWAVKNNNLLNAKWLKQIGQEFDILTVFYAISNDNKPMILWLEENNCHLLAEKATAGAAAMGNLELVKWLHGRGYKCNERTFALASYHGHLNVMKWLLDHDCPWDEGTFNSAAKNGNLDNMKWLLENGCPWNLDTHEQAVFSGYSDNVIWLIENGCPWRGIIVNNILVLHDLYDLNRL